MFTFFNSQRNIDELHLQLRIIDDKISGQSCRVRSIFKQPDGERMSELALSLIKVSPSLMKAIASWDIKDVAFLRQELSGLVLEDTDPILNVSGFSCPPSDALVSYCNALSGSTISKVSVAAMHVFASVPIVGTISGANEHVAYVADAAKKVKVAGKEASDEKEWGTVVKALKHSQALFSFEHNIWRRRQLPFVDFSDREKLRELEHQLTLAVEFKQLVWKIGAKEEMERWRETRQLDSKRSKMCCQIQRLAEELVDSSVVMNLSRSFSPDAQSALIRFSQIAGKAKFSRSSQASRMTQRQRRRRKEYLDAFDRCCRFIPCWVLTTSQISDYLPPECIFDLVVIDEASQSDITALPGLLRGKQWLIVGDGKQVSPTECFVSEDQIDSLRAALPSSPLENSLLPGQSLFDMCSQAFPRGRVVLREHFRSAEEIVAFSNNQFYDSRLVPLRLPTKSERLAPSVVDVRVDGVKTGKVNEIEADKVVELVREAVSDPDIDLKSRSIGVISLIGDEQSRIIRGRLLDSIGPEKMARHNILVGDPPTFQGAERDIIFLSMVCSKGSAPTQNQLMHFQRANVAMSRARDRVVLVRSIDIGDIPSFDDIKIAILEYFQSASRMRDGLRNGELLDGVPRDNLKECAELLKTLLVDRGYIVRPMGEVWRGAFCLEDPESDTRAAVLLDCEGESDHEWKSMFAQQKAIERVGWKCLRLNALSLLADFSSALDVVFRFLSEAGIQTPTVLFDESEETTNDSVSDDVVDEQEIEVDVDVESHRGDPAEEEDDNDDVESRSDQEVVFISSDEENGTPPPASSMNDAAFSSDFGPDEGLDAAQFGEVVDLNFLRDKADNGENLQRDVAGAAAAARSADRSSDDSSAYQGDLSDTETSPKQRRRRKYRRLDKNSPDGRWYPNGDESSVYDANGAGGKRQK